MKRHLLISAAAGLSLSAKPTSGQLPDLARETTEARRVLAFEPMTRTFHYLCAGEKTVWEVLSLCDTCGSSGLSGPRSQLLYRLFRMWG